MKFSLDVSFDSAQRFYYDLSAFTVNVIYVGHWASPHAKLCWPFLALPKRLREGAYLTARLIGINTRPYQ